MKFVLKLAVVLAILTAVAGAPAAQAGGPPFAASLAEGKKLPLPYGIGITLYDQVQDYRLDSLSLGIPGFANLPLDRFEISNRITDYNVQMDVWLFPFLNVFGLVGSIDGSTEVDFSNVPLPFPLGRLAITYDGTVYGGGMTLAAGGDVWFTSLTGVVTKSDLSGDFDSSAKSLVVMPRLGLHNQYGALWVGAMYLDSEEKHSGTIVLPYVGPVPFAVDLKQKDRWNGLVGLRTDLAEHWTLDVEGGFGNRSSASATVGWRF
ncbi:MAG: hypothetical protein ABI689_10605 [Thermoanaerobaculia bacterium]